MIVYHGSTEEISAPDVGHSFIIRKAIERFLKFKKSFEVEKYD